MGMSFEVSDPEEMCDLMCGADVRICPTCGKEVVRDDMLFTHDCHGIAFRLVCFDCYEKLMAKAMTVSIMTRRMNASMKIIRR